MRLGGGPQARPGRASSPPASPAGSLAGLSTLALLLNFAKLYLPLLTHYNDY